VGRLEELVRAFVQADKPTLGVCYGHQILARAMGGRDIVRRGSTPEFGWTKIAQTAPSPLFKGLPEIFTSFSSHFEEVSRLAPGFIHLAKSDACAIQGVQLQGKRVFGIQFHPEKNIAEAEEVFQSRRSDPKSPPLLGENQSGRLFDPKVGEQIFENFYAC
jgi:GMP synthase (glutamine-hydrolysing)